MVEAVKRHILNMLHLSARPNLTQPVPRAALLNAIKKLHVGRVSEDGSVEIQEDGRDDWASPPPDPPSEIITFGEPGELSGQSQVCKVHILGVGVSKFCLLSGHAESKRVAAGAAGAAGAVTAERHLEECEVQMPPQLIT